MDNGGIATAIAQQRERAFVSALPGWVDPLQTVVSESSGMVRVTVRCRCSAHAKVKVQQRVHAGQEPAAISQKLAAAAQHRHDKIHPACPAAQPGDTATAPEQPSVRERQLETELQRNKRRKRASEGKLEVVQAKLVAASAAVADQSGSRLVQRSGGRISIQLTRLNSPLLTRAQL